MRYLNSVVIPIVIAIVVLAGIVFWFSDKPTSGPQPVACTQEAKLCPDGSYVGRTGPQCEFAACPSGNSSSTATSTLLQNQSGISGTVLLGPTCPVQRIPPDPQCADKPYETMLTVTSADQTRVIKTFSSDANGQFTIQVPVGDYSIRSAATTNILPRCSSNGIIHVVAGLVTKADVSCDTGIR